MEKESILTKILKALGSILFCLILLFCAAIFIFNQIFEYHGVYGTSMAPTLNAESEDDDAIYIRKNIPRRNRKRRRRKGGRPWNRN